jgi:hypothetical protein
MPEIAWRIESSQRAKQIGRRLLAGGLVGGSWIRGDPLTKLYERLANSATGAAATRRRLTCQLLAPCPSPNVVDLGVK